MTTASGSALAQQQATVTLTSTKVVGTPPDPDKYYLQAGFSTPYPANTHAIGGSYVIKKIVAGGFQTVASGQIGTQLIGQPAGTYTYTSPQHEIGTPPAGGDVYFATFTYRIVPVGGPPPVDKTKSSSDVTVLP